MGINLSSMVSALKVPDVVEQIFKYLTTKTIESSNQLEVTLQAFGFTTKQLLDNFDSENFIKSYRETSAIDASIFIIKNSEEFSDKEKIQLLNEIHYKEIQQQNRAEKHELMKKVVTVGTITLALTAGYCFTSSLTQKTSIMIPQNKHNLSLPFMKQKKSFSKFLLPKK